MLPYLVLMFCSSPDTARMLLVYATNEAAACLQVLQDFAEFDDSGFAPSPGSPDDWINHLGEQLYIESVYQIPPGDVSAIRRLLGDNDAPHTDKHLVASLLEDARRRQTLEPNAGTLSRINEAVLYLQ